MRSVVVAIVLVGCRDAAPPPQPPPAVIAGREPLRADAARGAPAADAGAVDAGPGAMVAAGRPTCGAPWRSAGTLLDAVVADADGGGATLCASSIGGGGGRACVHFDAATHAFEVAAAPAVAAVPARAQPALPIAANEAAAMEEHGLVVDVSPDGARAVAALPVENVVAVFDTATARRTATLRATRPDAACVGPAFFVGNGTLYASARRCEDPDQLAAWQELALPDGARTLPVAAAYDANTVVELAEHRWLVASLKPSAAIVVDDRRAAIVRRVSLAGLDAESLGRFALGVTPFGTLMTAVPPVVALGTGGALLAVGARGVAVVPPTGDRAMYVGFPKCPK